MKLNILQLICLINYVVTFPDELFDELWETNQSEPQANNNPIEPKPKIKVESNEEQFDRDEPAIKGMVNEHEPHYGAVKMEGKVKHEFEWWNEESREFKEQLEDHVKEEDQDGQAPNTFGHKKIGDDDENLEEDDNKFIEETDQDEQQNDSNEWYTVEIPFNEETTREQRIKAKFALPIINCSSTNAQFFCDFLIEFIH
uniref:Uncharacterized protein n=1 Tax=Globodera rostochiensis TaxID=31243 RepID=A0A914GRV6_GLORO